MAAARSEAESATTRRFFHVQISLRLRLELAVALVRATTLVGHGGVDWLWLWRNVSKDSTQHRARHEEHYEHGIITMRAG